MWWVLPPNIREYSLGRVDDVGQRKESDVEFIESFNKRSVCCPIDFMIFALRTKFWLSHECVIMGCSIRLNYIPLHN